MNRRGTNGCAHTLRLGSKAALVPKSEVTEFTRLIQIQRREKGELTATKSMVLALCPKTNSAVSGKKVETVPL
jgi:hypothetical protein